MQVHIHRLCKHCSKSSSLLYRIYHNILCWLPVAYWLSHIVVVPSLIPRPCPAFHPLQCGKVHMGESLVSFHMWSSDVCVGAQNSERQGYQLARGDCHSDWQTNHTSQMVWWCTVDHCLSGYNGTRPWWNSRICESIIMQIGSTMYHY